ncbi:MAG: nucleotide exchange factor GrpE [Gemmataceae bacterium]
MSDEAIPPDAIPLFDPAQLAADLDKAQKQIHDYKLLVADFENSRKRLAQDAERQRKYAHEGLARDLLAALDNLDRAVEVANKAGEEGPLMQGVSATAGMLLESLKRYGVVKMDIAPGTPFDPNKHQAVAQLPTNDFAPGEVLQVFQSGFMLHDRVLRPASVVVAAEPPAGGSVN